jgi:hypothetical protein
VPDPPPGLSRGHSSLSVRLLVARATCFRLSDTARGPGTKFYCQSCSKLQCESRMSGRSSRKKGKSSPKAEGFTFTEALKSTEDAWGEGFAVETKSEQHKVCKFLSEKYQSYPQGGADPNGNGRANARQRANRPRRVYSVEHELEGSDLRSDLPLKEAKA